MSSCVRPSKGTEDLLRVAAFVSWGLPIMNDHKLDGFEQQKSTFSWFWRPEAQDQVVSRPSCPPEPPGEGPSCSSWWFPASHSLWPCCSTQCLLPPCDLLPRTVLMPCLLVRTPVMGFRAHPKSRMTSSQDPEPIISAKTLLLDKVIF